MNSHCLTASPIEVIAVTAVTAVTALVAVVVFLALAALSPSSELHTPARTGLVRAALCAIVWTAATSSAAAVTALAVFG